MKTIGPVDVAKLVRGELKIAFPGVKFTVKTKNSSIRVGWVDGPTRLAVQSIVGKYEGAEFDPTIDLKTYNDTPYGNDYIFFEREFSDAKLVEALEWYLRTWANPEKVTFVPSHQSQFGSWIVSGHFECNWEGHRVLNEYLEEKVGHEKKD